MSDITITNYTVATNNKNLFNVENITIRTGDKIGFTAFNGAGKTTFINQLINVDNPQAIKGRMTIGYLAQLQIPTDASAGQVVRQAVARLLHSEQELIILDEPSANLDVKNRKWLIQQLKRTTKTILIISHDRELLQQVPNKMWYLADGLLRQYGGNYTQLSQYQADKYTHEQHLYQAHQAAVKKEKAFFQQRKEHIDRLEKRVGIQVGADADSQAKHLMKGIKKFESKLANDVGPRRPNKRKSIKIQLAMTPNLNLHAIKLLHLPAQAIKRKQQLLFNLPAFDINFGQHVGLIGDNGVGKSTFMHFILQQVKNPPKTSEYYQYSALKVGYFDQLLQNLNPEKSILANIKQNSIQDEQVIFDLLGMLGFRGDEMDKPVSLLSGGEKVRATLAQVLLGDNHLLLLDEPTNYLDIDSLEALAEFLPTFPGAFILISHDKQFTKDTCSEIYQIENQQLTMVGKQTEQKDSKYIKQKLQELNFKKDLMILDTSTSITELKTLNQEIEELKNQL